MASVQPRAGKFQLRVKHKLLPKPFFATFDDETSARNYGEQLEALLSRGIVAEELLANPAVPPSPLLSKVIHDYLVRTSPAPSSAVTVDKLIDRLKGVRVSDVTYAWAEQWIRDLKTGPGNLTPSTIRQKVQALARVLDWHYSQEHEARAKRNEPMPVNVLRLLPKGYSAYADGSRKDLKRDFRLGPDDEARIREALVGVKRADRERPYPADPMFELLFDLIINTGLRLREAFWLRVEQVDPQRRLLHVDGTKGHRGVIKPRTVPLTSVLRDQLSLACSDKKPGELIFPYWDGTKYDLPRTSARLSARFATLFDYAGVPHLTEHDLRHEATCRWITMRNGDGQGWLFNEVEICRILGWSSTNMLLRYASLRGEDLSSRLA